MVKKMIVFEKLNYFVHKFQLFIESAIYRMDP